MKKSFFHTLLCCFLVVTLTQSCKKNFFNLYPTDQLSPGSFWKTEGDAVAALAGCYNSLAPVNNNVLPYLDVLTPNAYNEYPWEGWKDISRSAHTPLGPEGPSWVWSGCYQGIGRVNTFLANIDRPEMDEEVRTRMKSEVLFLRAYYYFTLSNFFGGVPLITEPPALEQAKLPRNTKDEIINQVLSDLDAAAPGLPVTIASSDNGRATKGAALALRTRVSLYQKDWAQAAATAQRVMDLDVYHLFPSYRELFLPQHENNSEIIFDVQYTVPDYTSSWDTYLGIYDGNILTASIGWSSIEPTTDFVDDYEMEDGSTWSPANPVADPSNKYNNRDPRLDQTLFRKGKKYLGIDYPVDADGYPGIYTGFSFKKYTLYDNQAGAPNIDYGKSYINGIILRYADILMMYAEAKNELSGPDQSVYNAVNAVRSRAGLPDLPAGLDQSGMRDRIRHERRMEFVLEGLYYLDVIRWGIANDVLNRDIILDGSYKKGAVDERTFVPSKNEVWPIPQREIDFSQNAIEQNPNY
jgi:hypothetical protein